MAGIESGMKLANTAMEREPTSGMARNMAAARPMSSVEHGRIAIKLKQLKRVPDHGRPEGPHSPRTPQERGDDTRF